MGDQTLKQYFAFDESDLEANRKGQITQKQLARIKSGLGLGKILILVIGLVLVAALAVPMISAIRSLNATSAAEWIIASVSLLIGLAMGRWLLRRIMMKDEYQLGKVEGRVNLVTTSGNHTTYYELHIGGQEFDVDEGINDTMNQGDAYIVYYIKDFNDILSVEELSKTK